jgi:hypothetical protein
MVEDSAEDEDSVEDSADEDSADEDSADEDSVEVSVDEDSVEDEDLAEDSADDVSDCLVIIIMCENTFDLIYLTDEDLKLIYEEQNLPYQPTLRIN